MQNNILAGVAGLVIAACTAIFAYLLWKTTKTSMKNQILLHLLSEYRSLEMLHAIRRLWEFWRLYGSDINLLREQYEQEYKREYESLKFKSGIEQILEEQSTLHNQRRVVSQFYTNMAMLYFSNALPETLIMQFWSSSDLEIIPNIIIPLDEKTEEMCRGGIEERKYRKVLLRFFEDSLKYKKKQEEFALMIEGSKDSPRDIILRGLYLFRLLLCVMMQNRKSHQEQKPVCPEK